MRFGWWRWGEGGGFALASSRRCLAVDEVQVLAEVRVLAEQDEVQVLAEVRVLAEQGRGETILQVVGEGAAVWSRLYRRRHQLELKTARAMRMCRRPAHLRRCGKNLI